MFPDKPTALLLGCPELTQPESLGTSLVSHSGMKIDKASDTTSVFSIFLIYAKKSISPGECSRKRVPACTEVTQNTWTK